MTYAKQLSEDRMMALRPLLKQIGDLPDGEWLTVNDTPAALTRLRGDIYTWLHNKSLKPLFRVRRLSVGELRIERLAQGSPVITTSHQESPGETFCRENLLAIDSIRVAEATIAMAVEKGTLSQRESVVALAEWRRIQG